MFAAFDQYGMFHEGNGINQLVREYILSICAAAILCAIAVRLPGKDALTGKALRIVTGLFMLFTLLRPFADIRLDRWDGYFGSYQDSAASAVADGEAYAYDAVCRGIKEQLGAYILDKAASLGAELTVEITLLEGMPPELTEIILCGEISPYAKSQLTDILIRELGLEDEELRWI